MRKCRQALAITLFCIILLLNFAVEYSHEHLLPQNSNSAFSQSIELQNDLTKIDTYRIGCLACLFGQTQLAPELFFWTIKSNQVSIPATFFKAYFFLVIIQSPYYLRGPPAA